MRSGMLNASKFIHVSATIFPIRLAKKTSPRLDNINLQTAGWGPGDGSKTLRNALHFLELTQISKKACQALTKELYVSYPAMTACLDSTGSTKGFCYVRFL
jgi:hypothetical protein